MVLAWSLLSVFLIMTPLADAAPSTPELKRDVNCGQVSIRRRYLYRASNPTIGDHLYTTDKAELTSLLSQGYSDEGVEAEIWSDLGDGTGPVRTPFFRLLHINSGVHLFTTDTNERDTLVGTGSYVYEKTVGYVQTDSTCGAIPLHRLWHSPEDHLLTINPIEKEHSINKEGYTYEFIQGYVWNPCGIDQVDFLRGRNQARSDHFYTTSKAEMDAAVKNNGYVQEETQAVIWSTRTGGLTPLYRLYSSDPRTDHFYTIDLDERNAAIKSGWRDEGITGYVLWGNTCGSIPMYRLFLQLGTSYDHFYTPDDAEKAFAINTNKYVDEGIAFWAGEKIVHPHP